MTETMSIKASKTTTDFETGTDFVMNDVLDGVCFAHSTDAGDIELLQDIAENTDWDKLREAIGDTCNVNGCYNLGTKGLVLELQWTTGLEFADGHEGGGFLGQISFDCWESPEIANISVEWNDKWICDNGIDGRDDESVCMGLIVDAIKFGTEHLA